MRIHNRRGYSSLYFIQVGLRPCEIQSFRKVGLGSPLYCAKWNLHIHILENLKLTNLPFKFFLIKK